MAKLDVVAVRRQVTNAEDPLLSVVVTSYTTGRLQDVQELLDTLLSQTYPKLEVVFVGERDLELCRRVEAYALEKGMQNLRVVFNRGSQGLAPARTLGVKHSQGGIIAFIDDDAIASPDWADSIVRMFQQNESAIGVTGPAQPIWREEGLSWLPEELYWLVSCTSPRWAGPDTLREVRSAWGVNSAFRREAFESRSFSEIFVGGNQGLPDGVKAGLLGDETEFSIRVSAETKRPIYYSPSIRVSHKVYASRLTSRFIRRRAFWEGYTKAVLRRTCRAQMSIWLDMSMEHTLLRRIVLYLLPSLLLLSVKSPRTGWPGLRSTLTVLLSVGLGYFAGKAPLVGRWISRRYS